MKNRQYFALIGDIIDSKKIENRFETQRKLESVLTKINQRYAKSIASQFTLTLGDEFQAVLKKPGDILKIIHEIYFEMYPVKIRFGIGLGLISTEMNYEQSLGADGPAYHEARKAIDFVHENEGKNARYHTQIALFPEDTSAIKLLNLSLSNYSSIFSSWDTKVFETVKLMQESGRQQDVADKLGISQQAVMKRLQKANYYQFRHLYQSLNEVFESWRMNDD